MLNGWKYPFGQLGPPVPGVSPYKFTHSLIPSMAVEKAEKALALHEPCSAITKTSLPYHRCVQHKSETEPPTTHCEEN